MKLDTREIFGLGVLAIVLIVAYQKGLFSKDRGRIINANVAAQDGSTQTYQDQQLINKATSIKESLENNWSLWSSSFSNILIELKNMNDSDLIALSNKYAQLFPNYEYPTLYRVIDAEYTWYFSDDYDNKQLVLTRLQKLGVA